MPKEAPGWSKAVSLRVAHGSPHRRGSCCSRDKVSCSGRRRRGGRSGSPPERGSPIRRRLGRSSERRDSSWRGVTRWRAIPPFHLGVVDGSPARAIRCCSERATSQGGDVLHGLPRRCIAHFFHCWGRTKPVKAVKAVKAVSRGRHRLAAGDNTASVGRRRYHAMVPKADGADRRALVQRTRRQPTGFTAFTAFVPAIPPPSGRPLTSADHTPRASGERTGCPQGCPPFR